MNTLVAMLLAVTIWLPMVQEPPYPHTITMQSEAIMRDGEPDCILRYFYNLGWTEVCTYRMTVTTSDNIVQAGFCLHELPFGGCSFPNAKQFDGNMIVWDDISVRGPRLHTLEVTTADLDVTEYEFTELTCTGDCDWQSD